MSSEDKIIQIIKKELFKELYFWWPVDLKYHYETNGNWRVEVIVGAILTQNTKWDNVERAIANLKNKGIIFDEETFSIIDKDYLASLTKPVSFYNIKAERIISLFNNIIDIYGSLNKMQKEELLKLREFLLSQKGIGKETADVIILYAIEKPIFVIDAYTKKLLQIHQINVDYNDYDDLRKIFENLIENHIDTFKNIVRSTIKRKCIEYYRQYFNYTVEYKGKIPLNPCNIKTVKDNEILRVIVYKELHAQIDMYMKRQKNKVK